MVGEKVHPSHVEEVLRTMIPSHENGAFAMVSPSTAGNRPPCYLLYVEAAGVTDSDIDKMCTDLDKGLMSNYHYRHARVRGQLAKPRAYLVSGNARQAYVDYLAAKGMVRGDIKFTPLSLLTEWREVFDGAFAEHRSVSVEEVEE